MAEQKYPSSTHWVVISHIPVEGHAHPGSHAKQALASVADAAGWYVPAKQLVGAVDPCGQYAPTVHARQSVVSLFPVSPE